MTDDTDIHDRAADIGRGGADDLPDDEAEEATREYEQQWRDVTNSVGEWGWFENGADPDAIPERPALLTREGDTVLPRGKTGMLAGAGGAGKSTALIQLAVAVATGGEWLGTYDVPEPGNVFLALGEDDPLSAQRNLTEAADALELDRSDLRAVERNLVVAPLKGKQKTLTEQPATRLEVEKLKTYGAGEGNAKVDPETGEPWDLSELRSGYTDHADTLENRLQDRDQWSLIILDPIRRFAGDDVETDSAAATRMVRLMDRWAAREYRDDNRNDVTGPTVLFSHHTGKKTTGAGGEELYRKVRQQDLARGSSALTDGARWQANMVYGEVDDPETPIGERSIRDLVLFAISKVNDDRTRPVVELERGRYGTLTEARDVLARQELHAKGELEGSNEAKGDDTTNRDDDASSSKGNSTDGIFS